MLLLTESEPTIHCFQSQRFNAWALDLEPTLGPRYNVLVVPSGPRRGVNAACCRAWQNISQFSSPKTPWIDILKQHKICKSPDFEALKLGNVPSGGSNPLPIASKTNALTLEFRPKARRSQCSCWRGLKPASTALTPERTPSHDEEEARRPLQRWRRRQHHQQQQHRGWQQRPRRRISDPAVPERIRVPVRGEAEPGGQAGSVWAEALPGLALLPGLPALPRPLWAGRDRLLEGDVGLLADLSRGVLGGEFPTDRSANWEPQNPWTDVFVVHEIGWSSSRLWNCRSDVRCFWSLKENCQSWDLPDGIFHNLWAATSGERRILCSSETSRDGF